MKSSIQKGILFRYCTVIKFVYYSVSMQPLEFNVSMEEPSTSGVSVSVTHTGDHLNAADATSMSYGMHLKKKKFGTDKHNTFLRCKTEIEYTISSS